MKALLFIVAVSAFAQAPWTTVCNGAASGAGSCSGSNVPNARGFNTKLPHDTVNSEFLYFGARSADTTIYSTSIFGYNPATRTFAFRVSNGGGSAEPNTDCPQNGAPGNTYNPLLGHPLGYLDFDITHGKMYIAMQLCQSQNMGYTSFYVASTQTFGTILANSFAASGGGTYNASPNVEWNTMTWVSGTGANKAVYCCDFNSTTLHVITFDGVSTYADVSGSVTGTLPPLPLAGAATMDDGAGNLWILAGCNGTLPGANSSTGVANSCNAASGHNENDLYKLNISTLVFTKLAPSGTKPVTTYGSFPFAAIDKVNGYIYDYSDNNTLLRYSISGNTWSPVSTSGSGPAFGTCSSSISLCNNLDGNMAGYDSGSSRFVLMYPSTNGQSTSPIVQDLQLSAPSLSVPLTIQEALPIGVTGCTSAGSCGIARTNEPFRVGVPIPDSAAITVTSSMGLTGASAGQFRILSTWPSGNIQWLEIQGIIASLSAGGTASVTLANSGSGNFGGSTLGTDNGSTITVATGTATYTIKKANFNLIDVATVGASNIITTSASATRGLVLMGPANPGTTCGTCTTPYTSANDSSSTASIEENGPVETVIKATGQLKDGSGNAYLRYTARLHFWQNKSGFKIHLSLQNAEDNSSSFNTAFKGFASFEARLDTATGGTNTYAFQGASGSVSGTFSASEDATLVQLYSNWMQDIGTGDPGEWNTSAIPQNSTQSIIPRSAGGGCSDPYCYPDNTRVNEGYVIKDGVTVLDSGTRSQIPGGWCNAENGSNKGMLAGVSYLVTYWPKSCELNSGGTNITVGIWPKQITGFNWWICYTCYQITDLIFIPHDAALSSNSNEFLKIQYDLIGRADISQYNSANVFTWGPMATAAQEDSYFTAMSSTWAKTGGAPNPAVGTSTLCCANDTISGAPGPYIFRIYAFGATGGINESDISESYLANFISRGQTGKYVFARFRERFIEQEVLPRSDFSLGWRSKSYPSVVNAIGFPIGVSSANSTAALQNWSLNMGGFEQHSHIYGMPNWYYSTGEEHYRDTLSQGYYDIALNANLPENGNNADLQYPSVPRAIGPRITFANRIHDYATATGNPTNAATGNPVKDDAWTVAEAILNKAVRAVAVSPLTSCAVADCQGTGDYGLDRNRGFISAMQSTQGWNVPQLQTIGTGNGSQTVFAFTLTPARLPVECGGSSQFPTIIITAGAVTGQDDTGCAGTFSGSGITSGSINYSTGVGTVTFSVAPANTTPVTAYFFFPSPASLSPLGTQGFARLAQANFQQALVIQALMNYAASRGPSWSSYEDTLDLAYGMAWNFVDQEMTVSNNTSAWNLNGIHPGVLVDFCNDPRPTSVCHADGPHTQWWSNDSTALTPFAAEQTIWWLYAIRSAYFGETAWVAEWQTEMYRTLSGVVSAPNGMTEYGRPELSNLVYRANNPSLYPTLNDMTITGFVDNGSGSYTLSWTVPSTLATPSGLSTPYKFKWGAKQIVPAMQFDSAETNTYGQNTTTKMPWFAATNVSNEPTPNTAGTTQSYTFSTSTTGLSSANFSLKAYGATAPPPGSGGSSIVGVKMTGAVIH